MRLSSIKTAPALAAALGERLRQARLNADLTQAQVALVAGISAKAVTSAERGNSQLETFIAIMQALGLTDQLDLFLPEQPPSPIMMAKLAGKKRKRATGDGFKPENRNYEW
ncbi:MAG: helix-turn-helix transcriptional regulator [Marinospirillum sp.]|nr:helix-turn-helix transcriptional regulator [Marinospirillum sp.]